MLVGHFSPNKKRQAWGSVRLEKMRHSVPREKDSKEPCSFLRCRVDWVVVFHTFLWALSLLHWTQDFGVCTASLGPHALGREGPTLLKETGWLSRSDLSGWRWPAALPVHSPHLWVHGT